MSHFKAKMHQIRFPASVHLFVRFLDGVWHLTIQLTAVISVLCCQLLCWKFACREFWTSFRRFSRACCFQWMPCCITAKCTVISTN